MCYVASSALHLLLSAVAAILYYSLFGSTDDVVLLSIWMLWKTRSILLGLLQGHKDVLLMWTVIATLAPVSLHLAKARLLRKEEEGSTRLGGPTKPMLFPCKTTHTRMFPKKHSFSYSYLMVGVPVDWEGTAGGMISAGQGVGTGKGCFQIDAADYLERGKGQLGLRSKLDAYLESQGVDRSLYPHAYLVTAPKFMGYQFNPVSFWYLYSAGGKMTAMVLEVNNTFDERRIYFLPDEDDMKGTIGSADLDDGPPSEEPIGGLKAEPMRHAWPKDFHVSPFNSRKGEYSLVAFDPWAPSMQGSGSINTTIKLSSSKKHAKLLARIFSTGPALEPGTMSLWQKLTFLSKWCWVGFVTFPRIAKQAGVLYFKRKLHVWYRPEPLKQSIGRRADKAEQELESIFRTYLRHLVGLCRTPLRLRYVPSGVPVAEAELMLSAAAQSDTEETEVRILTPVFYSRFVHYAHGLEALFCELEDSRTIWLSRPDLLPKLVLKKASPPLHTCSYIDYAYFTLIRRLRRRPERIDRPMTSIQPSAAKQGQTDIRAFRLSSIDGFVLSQGGAELKRTYRSLVLRLFMADRVAFGSLGLLRLQALLVRVLLARLVTT